MCFLTYFFMKTFRPNKTNIIVFFIKEKSDLLLLMPFSFIPTLFNVFTTSETRENVPGIKFFLLKGNMYNMIKNVNLEKISEQKIKKRAIYIYKIMDSIIKHKGEDFSSKLVDLIKGYKKIIKNKNIKKEKIRAVEDAILSFLETKLSFLPKEFFEKKRSLILKFLMDFSDEIKKG